MPSSIRHTILPDTNLGIDAKICSHPRYNKTPNSKLLAQRRKGQLGTAGACIRGSSERHGRIPLGSNCEGVFGSLGLEEVSLAIHLVF